MYLPNLKGRLKNGETHWLFAQCEQALRKPDGRLGKSGTPLWSARDPKTYQRWVRFWYILGDFTTNSGTPLLGEPRTRPYQLSPQQVLTKMGTAMHKVTEKLVGIHAHRAKRTADRDMGSNPRTWSQRWFRAFFKLVAPAAPNSGKYARAQCAFSARWKD